MKAKGRMYPMKSIKWILAVALASAVFPSLSRAQVPVIAFTKEESAINFSVKASLIAGTPL
jgi:hypothetical protein